LIREDTDFFFRLSFRTRFCFSSEPLVEVDRTPSRSLGLCNSYASRDDRMFDCLERLYSKWLAMPELAGTEFEPPARSCCGRLAITPPNPSCTSSGWAGLARDRQVEEDGARLRPGRRRIADAKVCENCGPAGAFRRIATGKSQAGTASIRLNRASPAVESCDRVLPSSPGVQESVPAGPVRQPIGEGSSVEGFHRDSDL